MYKRVMALLDLGFSTDLVIDNAVELARRFEAELLLFHVYPLPERGAWPTEPTARAAEHFFRKMAEDSGLKPAEYLHKCAREDMEAAVKRRFPDAAPRVELRGGRPAEEICRAVAELDVDVIVMATHSRKGVERFLIGSVAQKVVRQAPCTVLVVKPKGPGYHHEPGRD